jgi:hypothetical protein
LLLRIADAEKGLKVYEFISLKVQKSSMASARLKAITTTFLSK